MGLTGSSVTSTTGCKEPFLHTTERLTNTASFPRDSSLTANSIQREVNSLTVPTTLEGTAHSTLLPKQLEGNKPTVPTLSVFPHTPLSVFNVPPLCPPSIPPM